LKPAPRPPIMALKTVYLADAAAAPGRLDIEHPGERRKTKTAGKPIE
jgi:hypothetical protein